MSQSYLAHHGVKGQKWGIRRYQNKDGSLTDAGRKRIATNSFKRLMKKGALTSSTVKDPKTGEVYGVNSKTLKRKGAKAALKEVKDPVSLKRINDKNGKEFSKEYDTIYKEVSKYSNMSMDNIQKESKYLFREATGYSYNSIDEIMKKYGSKYYN